MGYLPGSFEEKSKPFLAILDDILGEQFGTEMFIASGKLEIGNLGAVRGRTFKNSIIFLTEMQNCSIEVIQLLVSRLGENSILVMNGDFRQIDDVKHGESSVRETINVLAGQEEFGWINLEKVERSKTANLARLFDEI
jgi:phosphate starvation-inducible PhoH-like protein